MENKLQELTQKLYQEGLEKGRTDADNMIAQARVEAGKILEQANAQAAKLVSDAERKASEMSANTRSELSLASRQSVASLKDMISDMVCMKALSKPVSELSMDAAFLKEMLVAIANNWSGASGGKIDLVAMLPEAMEKKFEANAKDSTSAILASGVELVYSNGQKSGFRIGPKEGGFHISFTEEDFAALLGCYLRPKVAQLLYGKEEK